MKGRMQKNLSEVKCCPQKARTESEGYVGAQTFMWICEDNIVEVPSEPSEKGRDTQGQWQEALVGHPHGN